jgi:hypothetical protein
MITNLEAGFARQDITPHPNFPNGIWMAQKHLRAEGIHRKLYAGCLIVGDAERSVALLGYDLTILSRQQVVDIQSEVCVSTPLRPDQVWLYCTHNHAAPVTQDFYDREGADEVSAYIRSLKAVSGAIAREAWEARRPVRAAIGKGTSNVGVNRDLLYEKRMITGPNPCGFADPEVGVLRIDDASGKPLVGVVTYGCHPTYLGPANRLISPDYPGVLRDVFEQHVPAPCLFLQAGGGNVGPVRGFSGDTAEVEREGTILGLEAAKTFLSIDSLHRRSKVTSVVESGAPLGIVTDESIPPAQPGFDYIVREVPLPLNRTGDTVYDTVERDLELAGEKVLELRRNNRPKEEIQKAEQVRLRHQLRLDRKRMYYAKDSFDIAIRALRLDDTCFVSLACEAYSEIAVAVKAASPFAGTIFAAYEGPDVIYVAPRQYYRKPVPMEVFNSPFAEGASERLVEHVLDMLNALAVRARGVDKYGL